MTYLLVFATSYIFGSIPSGYIAGKFYGIDIRKFGSGNIGATNVYRVIGFLPTCGVFILDIAKGVAGVYLGQLIFSGADIGALLGGIGAISGHNWSIFLGFRGGRGVATSFGVSALLMPKVSAMLFIIWLIIVVTTRYVSLGSIVSSCAAIPLIWYFYESKVFLYFGCVLAMFILMRHRPNIQRLLKNEELKLSLDSASKIINKGNDHSTTGDS